VVPCVVDTLPAHMEISGSLSCGKGSHIYV
jgi:hypothetical protein